MTQDRYRTVKPGDTVECPECGVEQEVKAGLLGEGDLQCGNCEEIVGTAGESEQEFAKIRLAE